MKERTLSFFNVHVAYLKSLFSISRTILFPFIGFDYLSWSSEIVPFFLFPFRRRMSLAKWTVWPLDLPVGVTHLPCFLFLSWGFSIVLPFNQKLIFFVCVGGVEFHAFTEEQARIWYTWLRDNCPLSLSGSKFNESPMRLVCNSFSGELYRIILQSCPQFKKLNWLSWA